jgi:hypothetical protein
MIPQFLIAFFRYFQKRLLCSQRMDGTLNIHGHISISLNSICEWLIFHPSTQATNFDVFWLPTWMQCQITYLILKYNLFRTCAMCDYNLNIFVTPTMRFEFIL